MNSCGVCELSCANNEFTFQGACATCPLNTLYNAATNGCVCPQGFYMDSYGICQKLVLKPIDCPNGQYFDSEKGCVACQGDCKTCKSANVCTACNAEGYAPDSFGKCQPKCGDGLIVGNEACDSGNKYDPGCLNCKIQTNYSCYGQPSVCRSTVTVPSTPAAPTTPSTPVATPTAPTGVSLTQVGSVNINSNNVFITLKTTPAFTFANPTEMQSFMKTSFQGGPQPTVYCSQRDSPQLDIFDCLFIYPSGVPNSTFKVNFSFDYQNKKASKTIDIDPLKATYSTATSRSKRGV